MANELSNVTNNGLTEVVKETASSSGVIGKYLPIAGGFALGLLIGGVVDRFVITPIVKKVEEAAAKKASTEKKQSEDSKKEE